MQTYSEKLKSPKWQKKRLEILQRDNFTCTSCGDSDSELHVHHNKYIYGLDVHEYENELLTTLCKDCHGLITESKKRIKDIIDNCFVNTDNIYELELIIENIRFFNPYDLSIVRKFVKNIIK